MTDPYSNLADAWDDDQVAAAQVVSNIDAKPDRAMRAIQLAESTGVPATAIYPDLDEFERKQKTIAAAGMIQQNPHLASYMAKDPMNARLSLDDLAALDLTSEAVGRLGSKSAMGTFSERFFEGMQQAGQDTLSSLERVGAAAVAGYDWAGQQHEFDKLLQEPWAQSFFGVNNPAHPGKLAFAAVFGFDSFMRAFNAGMVATAETAGIVGEALTNDPAKGHQLVRDIYQTLQVAAAGPGAFGMTHPHVMSSAGVGPGISIKPFIDPLRAAAPWLREGKEPPLGVHPEIDKLIIEQSKMDLDSLAHAEREARKSQTREMDPERFAEFIREKTDTNIEISIDAIDRLYGEEKPGVEDGKLGMIPGVAEQLEGARASGGRIQVPLADWLAKVDPEVQKALHDDVAVRKGGTTKVEAEAYREQQALRGSEAQEPTPVQAEPVEAIREAAGLKPLFGEISQMEGGEWHALGWAGHEAYVRPEELWTKNEERINAAVQEVLDRIVGKSVENIAADTIRRPGNKTTHALYTIYENIKPIITWAFADPEVMGNIRHEAIHHLREYRFIKPEEWNILQRAALDGKWIEKYNINERYEGLSPFAKIEEAIAEAYKDWAERNVEAPAGAKPLFERIKALLDGVREKVKEILGFKPTYEQLFKKVESGEIAKRGPGKSRSGGMALKESRGPAQPELPGTRRMEDRKPFDRAPVGMSIDRAERYLKLIEKQHGEDLAKAEARAEKEQRKRQSTEWKAEAEAMRPEVTADVLNRPDVAVDRFLRDGILYDEQVDRVRIGAEYLTPEQQAALPKSYVAKKGMNPDDIAGLFGYDSGATMIERMAQYDRQWRESGVRREEFVRRQINQEINRRQELKHGRPLNESILEDAKEQAMSETQLSILHEQTYHFATEAGMEYPLKKEELQAIATKHFNNLPAEAVSSDRFLAESGRAGRAAEMAHLKGDAQEAFKQAQRQEYALHYAKLAQAEEKRQARFDKLARRYSTRTLPAGVDRPYALHAASLLEQAGYPMSLRADEIRTELQAGEHSSLPELHSHSRDFGGGVYDMLTQDIMDNGVKPMEEMTVQERRDFRDAVQAIHEEGRAKELLDIRGEKIAFQEFRDMVRENFEKRGLIDPQTRSKMMEYWWSIDAKLVTMENLLKDADFRQEMGPFFDAIIRTHEQSKSKAFQLEAELKESFDKLPGATFEWRQSLNKDLPNTLFVDPMAPTAPLKLRRENLLRIMLHQGTESNRYQLARGMMMAREGLKITEDRIEVGKQLIDQMIRTHATEQDAIFVKHIWDQHKKFRGEREQLQRNTSGNIVNWIEGRKVDFGFGEVDGEYYPLSPSRKYQLPGKEIAFETEPEHSKGPFQSVYTRATTPKNDLKQRTGKAYYVDITSPIENVAIELKHVIRDIAYRDFGIQAGKILYDPQIRNMFDRYYGPEYTKELIPWLKRALNIDNTHSRGGVYGTVEDFMRWARVNVTHSALGYNLATIATPSIGTFKPRAYGAYMANHAEAVKITKDFSKVLNDMETLMERDVHKAVGDYIKKTRYSAFQEGAVQASFYAIKKVQLAMARVTFYEKFMEERPKQLKEALDKGLSPEEAMKVANDRASILADAKLRERHGSTGRGDMSPILADQNEFVKTFGTMFMGYFSTMYNWRRAIAHNAREMVGAEAPEARMKSRKEFMDAMIGTVAVPALFTGVFYTRAKKDENWLSFLSRVALSETLGMYPLAREFTFWIDSGRFGSSPVHSMGDIGWNMIKDVRDTVQGKQPKKPFQHTMTALGSVGIVKGGMALGRQLGGIHNVFRRTEPPPRDFGEWMRLIRWGETKKPR